MNKKVISVLICSVIVCVSSTPTDSADDGAKLRNNNSFSYTESPKTTGAIVNTLANVAGRQIEDTPVDKSNKPSAVPPGTVTSTFSQSASNISNDTVPSVPLNPSDTTTTTPPSTTTAPPTTTNTTTPTTQITTTVPTTTTLTPLPTTTPTPTEPTKPSTSTTTSATTTAAAATTTVPAPTASPSKDRRFDGPSFIGGIVLSLGIMAIGFVAFKFYKARTERNYHTL